MPSSGPTETWVDSPSPAVNMGAPITVGKRDSIRASLSYYQSTTEETEQQDCPVFPKLPETFATLRREEAATVAVRLACGGRLAAEGDAGWGELVAFIAHGVFGGGAQSLLVGVFRCVAVTANDFFTALDADQPLGLAGVPGDFHAIGGAKILPRRDCVHGRSISDSN